jgi:outer membrane protein assembly factor BamB
MTDAKPKPIPPAQARPKPPRYFPGKVTSFLIVACLLMILLTRVFQDEIAARAPMFDGAFLNLSTFILGFIAFLTFFLWFVLRSSYPGLVRLLTFLAIPGVIVLFFTFFEIVEVNGNMVPTIARRGAPRKDATLGQVKSEEKPTGIDLATSTPTDFPQFLGPGRTNYLPGPKLADDWSTTLPKEIWRQKIGGGWSAFSVQNGYAVTLEQRGDEEWVTCYEVATGKPIWGDSIQARHFNVLGGAGPRSTPTIHNGKVYALGATGVFRCLDGATGKLLWKDDLLARYGLEQIPAEEIVMWGRSNSPLIVDNLVVVPAGGPLQKSKSLIAYDAETGKVVWEGGERQISYASPSIITLGGQRQIVIVNEETVTGNDIKTGKELWSHPWPGKSNGPASSSQAHLVGTDQLLLSKGYGGGAELISVKLEGGKWNVESLEKNPRVLKTKFTNLTIIAGHAYALSDGVLECVEIATLKPTWKKGRYGHGQVLGVSDKVLVLGENGELVLVAADPAEFRELGKIQALHSKTWNNLCLTGKLLLIRNAEEAACYELP